MDFDKLQQDLNLDPDLMMHMQALSSYAERIYPGSYALVLWSKTPSASRGKLARQLGFGSYAALKEHIDDARSYLGKMSLDDHFAIAKESGVADEKEMLLQLLSLFY